MHEGEKKTRILVVEDEVYIQQVICAYLTYSGFEVCCVSNGQEAMRVIPEFCPHLIVLDLMMQPVDGWEVLRWLHGEHGEHGEHVDGNTPFRSIPVLVLTARTQIIDQARGYEAGAVEYMTKPTQPSLLVERIRAILSLDPEQRATRQRQRREQHRETLERLRALQSDEFVY